jgi:hypothetical protein
MWNRRELLGVLGTGAAGVALLTNRSEAGDDQPVQIADPHAGHDPRHAAMLKECEEACGHCEATCNATFHHCVTQAAAGKAEHAKMAQMAVDCAAFCTLSAAMIARHSSLMVESCRACALHINGHAGDGLRRSRSIPWSLRPSRPRTRRPEERIFGGPECSYSL